MKSTTSSSKAQVLLHVLSRYRWFSIIYGLALFMAIPLQILFEHTSSSQNPPNALYLLSYSGGGESSLILLTAPVMAALVAFRFMQHKPEADLMHSLPASRSHLYFSHIIGGFLLIALPTCLIALSIALIKLGLGITSFTLVHILIWTLLTLVVGLIIYTITVFSGMLIGMTTLQGVFAYILMVLPIGLLFLTFKNLSYLLYGFSADFPAHILFYSPPGLVLKGFRPTEVLTDLPLYGDSLVLFTGVAIVLIALSHKLFKIRPVEFAGQPVVFHRMQPVFKYLSTLCCALLSSMFFMESSQSFKWMLIGYVSGALLGYCLSEIIMKKSFRAGLALKGYVVFIILSAALFGALKLDLTGYVHHTADASQIKEAYVSNYYGPPSPENIYTDPETIQKIIELHKAIVKKPGSNILDRNNARNYNYCALTFVYKDGKKLTRNYRISKQEFETQFEAIYNTPASAQKRSPLMLIQPKDVRFISVQRDLSNSDVLISEPGQIKEALTALNTDIAKDTWTYRNSIKKPDYNLIVTLNDGSLKTYQKILGPNVADRPEIYEYAQSSYTHFNGFLQKYSYQEKLKKSLTNVQAVKIKRFDSETDLTAFRNINHGTWSDSEPGVVTLKDKSDILACLSQEAFYDYDCTPVYYLELQSQRGQRTDYWYIFPDQKFVSKYLMP